MLLFCLYSEVKIKGISKTFCKQFSRDYVMTKIGRSQLRFEDDRFLRGQGQYTDDIKQSDDATLVFVRSPHAAARIVKVDLDRAKAIEGVIAILAGTKCTPTMLAVSNRAHSFLALIMGR